MARYLDHMTRSGRVTLRSLELAGVLRLERSELYRITRRLRVLGLFGIENDRGGTRGGRRYWRTAIEHDGAELDQGRHRAAWARIVAGTRATLSLAAERAYHAARSAITRGVGAGDTLRAPDPAEHEAIPPSLNAPPGATFGQRLRAAGMGGLLDQWGVTS